MLNFSTLNVCAKAVCGAPRLTAKIMAGIRSEYLVMRPSGGCRWLGEYTLALLRVSRKAAKIYVPPTAKVDDHSAIPPRYMTARLLPAENSGRERGIRHEEREQRSDVHPMCSPAGSVPDAVEKRHGVSG